MRALFVVLVFMFSLSGWAAESNPPAPTPRESAGKHQSEPSKPGEKSKAEIQEALSLIYEKIGTFRSEYQAYVDRKHANEKAGHEFLIAWGTVFLAAFTFALFIATYRLYRITVRLATEAKTAADRQFGITERSLLLTRDTIERELRPYLGIKEIYFAFANPNYAATNLGTIDQEEKLLLTFRNFGKTPGYTVEIQTLISLTPMPFNGTWIESPSFSAADHHYPMVNPDQTEELAIDMSEVAVKHSTKEFYLYGVIRYHSPVGGMSIDIRLEFCRKYIGANKFTPYGPHNQEGAVGEPTPYFPVL